jgi:hypothetical protein
VEGDTTTSTTEYNQALSERCAAVADYRRLWVSRVPGFRLSDSASRIPSLRTTRTPVVSRTDAEIAIFANDKLKNAGDDGVSADLLYWVTASRKRRRWCCT